MKGKKQLFQSYCQKHYTSLFESFDWMNTMYAPNSWDVALDLRGESVQGAWSYTLSKKWGVPVCSLPGGSPYSGPILKSEPGTGKAVENSRELKALNNLIEALPKNRLIFTHFNPSVSNIIPFQRAGFAVDVRYTHILALSQNDETPQFRPNITKGIRKAGELFQVRKMESVDHLARLKRLDYQERNIELPDINLIAGKALETFGESGRAFGIELFKESECIGATLFLADDRFVYYYSGVVHPELRNSGAMAYMLNYGITEARNRGINFNFEGSANPGIDRFFSSFGGIRTPYFRVVGFTGQLNNKVSSIMAKLLV